MAFEENLSKHLKALPAERQRQALSLMREDLRKVLDELTRQDDGAVLPGKERLETLVAKLLAERAMIRRKVEEMLDAAAALDPETAAELSSEESLGPNEEQRFSEKLETLFAHRGSIKVSGEQDFSAIRKSVIDHCVREENC